MNPRHKGYTLMELMIVVLIVAILSAAAIPLMHGRLDESKWTEGVTAAGMIRNAVKAYYVQTGIALIGRLDDSQILNALNMQESDLSGRCFVPSDYEILGVDDDGGVSVRVTGSQSQAPEGSKTLKADGTWE